MAAGKQDSPEDDKHGTLCLLQCLLNISKVLATLEFSNEDIENSIKSKSEKVMSFTGVLSKC